MITWIFGNSGAGKTTLAYWLLQGFCKGWVWLDGDVVRKIWVDLKYDKASRREQNMRIALLAAMLDEQGFNVLISNICPYADQRKEFKKDLNCKFIYVEGGKEGKEYPFDKPNIYEKNKTKKTKR